MENSNPRVFESAEARPCHPEDELDDVHDYIDSREIFDLIRHINDPEHPLTLEQLNVVQLGHIEVDDRKGTVLVYFTPTIPHCSMATLIGLSLKIDVKILPGSHSSELAVNKQLADKERIAAALENIHLLDVVNQCLTFAH